MDARPYIKFCVPCYDMVTWENSIGKTSYSQLVMKRETETIPLPFDFHIGISQGTIIEHNRNVLIQPDESEQGIHQKLKAAYTHYLFLDHDVSWTYDNVMSVLNRKVDIVSGCYRPKENPDVFVAGYIDVHGRSIRNVKAIPNKGLLEVGWVGGGFLLLTKNAIETMEYPWFWKTIHKYNNRAMLIGEDFYMCMNAKNHLLSVYLDTDVICNHEQNRYTETRSK